MGTDIYLYVERRENGIWRVIPPPPPPPESERYQIEDGKPRLEADGTPYVSPFWGPGFYHHECYGAGEDEKCIGADCPACLGTGRGIRWYQNRNYDAFAILTGTVRNGHGFAGCRTGSGFRGIVPEPRGVPEDCSPTIRDHNSWDHSPGWLALPEILAFDWKQVTQKQGVIPMRVADDPTPFGKPVYYEEWRKASPAPPASYCGDIRGQGVSTISAAEADRILAAPDREHEFSIDVDEGMDLALFARGGGFRRTVSTQKVVYRPGGGHRWFAQVAWTETYEEAASDFLEFVREWLVPLGNPADTRIVFGFDS